MTIASLQACILKKWYPLKLKKKTTLFCWATSLSRLLYELCIFDSFTPDKDCFHPVPSWVLRLSLRSASQSCTWKLNTFVIKINPRPELETSRGSPSIDWQQIFQAPPRGVRKETKHLGLLHATEGVSKGWDYDFLRLLEKHFTPCLGKRIKLLPLGLTFWELFSSGFWQLYPRSSAQLAWVSLKHCQWQMSGLKFWWLLFLHFGIQLLSSKRRNKPWRTWRENRFVSHLTPDGSP